MQFPIIVSFLLGLGLRTSQCAADSAPRVNTPLGTIEGYYNTAFRGRKFEAYEGIPYAEPPSRFEIATSVRPWSGVLEAKQVSAVCYQYNALDRKSSTKLTGSEDCLYLNVYTPASKHDTSELLPVIVYIHGGAFVFGAGSQYKPDYLLDRDVVLVTINYRLGPLGFLSTEDAVVSGNMGLKDQVSALRWVNDNIESFGGDPSRITIFGQSAGGASVNYHYLTNQTKDLFKGGMSLSGTALEPWAFIHKPLAHAQQLAQKVKCPTEDNQVMVNCLKALPVDQILNAVTMYPLGDLLIPNGFAPSVEEESNESAFITRLPLDIMASGDIQDKPWVTGVVSEEGLWPMAVYEHSGTSYAQLNDNWETLAPLLFDYTETVTRNDQPKVSKSIKEHYFNKSDISKATFKEGVRLFNDRLFYSDFNRATRLQAKANQSPVYTYYFSYRGAHSFSEALSETSENLGVAHCDDLSYVLQSFFDATTTAEDQEMQRVLLDLWVSYATNGVPDVGVEWPKLSSNDKKSRYMHIWNPTKIHMASSTNFGDTSFWSSLNLD